ncbi:hypothetical protein C8Q75DRAFT_810958 [Abortiporus biennis]|nr:hypothetical protein C8Q75DRAFT_810958 [Abortiporus biennis]
MDQASWFHTPQTSTGFSQSTNTSVTPTSSSNRDPFYLDTRPHSPFPSTSFLGLQAANSFMPTSLLSPFIQSPTYHGFPTPTSTPNISDSTRPFPIADLQKIAECTRADLLDHYNNYYIWRRCMNGFWQLGCPSCSQWISTGIGMISHALTTESHFTSLWNHIKSRKCQPQREILLQAEKTHVDIFQRSSSAPPSFPSTPTTDARVHDNLPSTTLWEEEDDQVPYSPCPSRPLPLSSDRKDRIFTYPRMANHCPGINLASRWNVSTGTFNETFPWQIMVTGLTHGRRDAWVDLHLRELASLATTSWSGTRYSLLNHTQLVTLLDDAHTEIKRLHLQALNASRRLGTALGKLNSHTQLLMTLAEGNIPRSQQLFAQALKSGASITAIVERVRDAIGGLYTAQLSDAESDGQIMDLALLVYRLGGHALVYALNHSAFKIPSLTSIRNYFSFSRLMPTLGTITSEEILWNLEEVLIKPRLQAGLSEQRGISLMMDEVALEEMVTHFKHTAIELGEAIHTGRVHMGKEMSVVAVSCFGDETSRTYPILAAPTCKQESAVDMKMLMELLVETYQCSRASQLVGPLWSFATDGDATRRVAGYALFVKTKLTSSSLLYPTLSHIPGLNLYTGNNEVTLDFDYKHIFKRFCTLLRQQAGITLNNGRVVNALMLSYYFMHLLQLPETKVCNLVFTDDGQDVPKALEFIHTISQLCDIDLTPYSNNINLLTDLDSIHLLSELLNSLVQPFINPSFNLSDQVTSLSKFAHLSFILFCLYHLHFMSNQLYGDSMTMIKAFMFGVCRQQQTNSQLHLFVGDFGTDYLEKLFGHVRMLGGHDSGMNYAQATQHLMHACDIDAVFSWNPHLDRGHRRLNLAQTSTTDHLHVSAWKGDLLAGRCDLPLSWKKGRDAAIKVLSHSQVDLDAYNFDILFANPDIDMLRPFGHHYDINDSSSLSSPLPHNDESNPDIGSSEDLTQEDNTVSPLDIIIENWKEDEDTEGRISSLTFEEALSQEFSPPEAQLPSGCGVDVSDYVSYKGKLIHKQTTLSLAMIRCTTLTVNANPHSAVIRETLISPQGNVKLSGQLLHLQYIPSGTSTPTSSGSLDSSGGWIWSGGLETTVSNIRGKDETAKKPLIVSIPGFLVEAANPVVIHADELPNISPDDIREINSFRKTWYLLHDILETTTALLWEKMMKTDCDFDLVNIPSINRSTTFPYTSPHSSKNLVCIEGTRKLQEEFGDGKVSHSCPRCGEFPENMRAHMGAHILRSLRNVLEKIPLKQPIGKQMPCGFCGTSGDSKCEVYMKISAQRKTIECKCKYAHSYQYARAEKGSNRTPCRNVPIICRLCHSLGNLRSKDKGFFQAYWRYNFEEHFEQIHPEYNSPQQPFGTRLMPADIWQQMEISESEESALGIPVEFIPPRFTSIETQSPCIQESTLIPNLRKRKAPVAADMSSARRKRLNNAA